jgi:DNA-binding XRE family transcriptional regulator
MPNLLKELKSEIVRLSRKEIKQELAPAKRVTAAHRALIAGLRKQVVALQKELSALRKALPTPTVAAPDQQEPQGRFWITGKGVKALRRKLGLTQTQFGKLAGVSSQTVVNWEGSDGKVEIRRKATIAQLRAIRGMVRRQAAEILGLGKGKAKAKAKPRAQKKPKKAALVKARAKVKRKAR